MEEEDAFLHKYHQIQSSDPKIAAEFLRNWFPFLSRDLCNDCVNVLSDRISSLDPENEGNKRDWSVMNTGEKPKMWREEREEIRLMNVKRMKEFSWFEKVKGKNLNILEGLELHTGVFNEVEQTKIVHLVYQLQEKGRNGQLKEHTFSAPHRWMRGKGRVTIQFGGCYNFTRDKAGNPPGILARGEVDPIPHLFKAIIRRLVEWHVLPPSCVPDTCIVNIYDEGDCIPPHIDHHDFLRPFCTISFLSECNILFGSNLKIEGPGEFSGSYAIPLPLGSVLVFKGNGADVAKHCVPAVPTKRISITFRKMEESKQPLGFTPDPDLQWIQPLPYEPNLTPVSSSSWNKYNYGSNHKSRAASQHVWRTVRDSRGHQIKEAEGNKELPVLRSKLMHGSTSSNTLMLHDN